MNSAALYASRGELLRVPLVRPFALRRGVVPGDRTTATLIVTWQILWRSPETPGCFVTIRRGREGATEGGRTRRAISTSLRRRTWSRRSLCLAQDHQPRGRSGRGGRNLCD